MILIDDRLKDLILLDSTSTVHLFKNRKLVSYLQKAETLLYLSTNDDVNVSRNEGKFDGLSAWFNENSIAMC